MTDRALPGLPDAADAGGFGIPLTTFADLSAVTGGPGAKLEWIRTRADDFRREFSSSGTPDSVSTHDLVTLPYPTRFGLFRAALSPAPFLTITNRMLVIRWTESDGRKRTLLFEPSDVEMGRYTPYFEALAKKTPDALEKLMVKENPSVGEHLARLGIRPEEVDYLLFDHLHTQDLRRWVGTTTEQADLGRRVEPFFPNARLVVQRDEVAAMQQLHPLQRPWYQAGHFKDLRPEAILAVDGGVLLGPGVAVVPTPGHVFGNQTLMLNTSTGIWASSENAIAAECLTPEHSRLPGVRRWTREWQQEVVLNANTLETTADQYNSLVLEKCVVDRSQADSRFLQFFPSSELTAHWMSPGTRPTFTHRSITHGSPLG
ncbi:hypothetical protein [Umezawaea tangerina]|uniref:Metallo-beta-lactamase superfamily protein n=1 Tax=Umezawaea tangerina TaxID=84725 RepID=A0A2T0THN6_9PSEU|nr:hypothetical protein [Umezawaea tangerina]PRY45119.1 hypothetical protein CLV43_102684 [Umezawaea tangerina]